MGDVTDFPDELVTFRTESPVEDMPAGTVYYARVFDVDQTEAREVARLLFKRVVNGHRMTESMFGSFFLQSLAIASQKASSKRGGYRDSCVARPKPNECHVAAFDNSYIDYSTSKAVRAKVRQDHLERTLWRALDTGKTVNIRYNGKRGGDRIHTVKPVKLYTDMFYGRHAGGLRRYNYDRVELINMSTEPNPPMVDGFPTQFLFTVTFHDTMTGTLRISQYRADSQSGYLQMSDFTRWSLKRSNRLWLRLNIRQGFVGESV